MLQMEYFKENADDSADAKAMQISALIFIERKSSFHLTKRF